MDIKERYSKIRNKEDFRNRITQKTGLKDNLLINYFSKNYCPKKYELFFDSFLSAYLIIEIDHFKELDNLTV